MGEWCLGGNAGFMIFWREKGACGGRDIGCFLGLKVKAFESLLGPAPLDISTHVH